MVGHTNTNRHMNRNEHYTQPHLRTRPHNTRENNTHNNAHLTYSQYTSDIEEDTFCTYTTKAEHNTVMELHQYGRTHTEYRERKIEGWGGTRALTKTQM